MSHVALLCVHKPFWGFYYGFICVILLFILFCLVAIDAEMRRDNKMTQVNGGFGCESKKSITAFCTNFPSGSSQKQE